MSGRPSLHPERRPMTRTITLVRLESMTKILDKKLRRLDELESRIKLLEGEMDKKVDKNIVVRYQMLDPKLYKKE